MTTLPCRPAFSLFPFRTLTRALAIAIPLALAALAWLPGSAGAQCVDYRDYLHRASSTALGGDLYDTALAEGYVLVAGTEGLDILDVADPEAPVVLSHTPLPPAHGVKVDGDRAYVVFDGGLRVFDIAAIADPQQIGYLPIGGDLWDIEIDGLFAYVAADTAGIHVIDIADPASPQLVETIDMDHTAFDLAVRDGYAFVVNGGHFVVIDLASHASVATLSSGDRPGPYLIAIALYGDAAYLLDVTFGIQVYDISDPLHPDWVNSGGTQTGGYGRLAVAEGRLYSGGGPGLQVFDLEMPFDPVFLGEVNPFAASRGISVAGDYAYVPASESGMLDVVDIAPPVAPDLVGSVYAGWATNLDLSGHYAFIACRWDGIAVVDISDPAAPVVITDATVPDWAVHLRVRGDYAYVACDDRGFQIVDISTLQALRVVGVVTTPGPAQWVALQGDLAYVADVDGLRIIDISNPAAPWIVGNLETPGMALAVAVEGDIAYVADDYELLTVDVSQPKAPVLLGVIPAWALTVELHEGLVYTASPSGMQVYDAANPAAPVLLDALPMPGYSMSISFARDVAYVAANGGGLEAVDVSEAGRLRAIGSIACWPAALAATEDYIYLIQNWGLTIYPAHCDPTAVPGGPAQAPAATVMLYQSHPNPFNPSTAIDFTLSRAGRVRLTVHDLGGTLVATLLDEPRAAGAYSAVWNGRDARGGRAASGVYFCRLQLDGDGAETVRMVLLK